MGYTADLSIAWGAYRAARGALANTLQATNIKEVSTKMINSMTPLHAKLNELLTEGVLVEEKLLDEITPLLEMYGAPSL